MRHQPRDGVTGDDRIGIDANKKLGILNMFNAVVEGGGLAGS